MLIPSRILGLVLLFPLAMVLPGCARPGIVSIDLEFRDAKRHEAISDAGVTLYWRGYGLYGENPAKETSVRHEDGLDEEGRFHLPRISEGFWSMKVDAAGYDEQWGYLSFYIPSDSVGVVEGEGLWQACIIERQHAIHPQRVIEYRFFLSHDE